MKIKMIAVLIPIFLAAGCAALSTVENSQTGKYATVVVSTNFNKARHSKVAVLPFLNSGKSGTELSISDKVSAHLMGLGFTVVERSYLESIMKELGLEISGALKKNDMERLGKLLNINVIVFGTISYVFIPGKSLATQYGVTSSEGYYQMSQETIRFTDVQSGEILITAFCDNKTNSFSMSEEIFLKLRTMLSREQW